MSDAVSLAAKIMKNSVSGEFFVCDLRLLLGACCFTGVPSSVFHDMQQNADSRCETDLSMQPSHAGMATMQPQRKHDCSTDNRQKEEDDRGPESC